MSETNTLASDNDTSNEVEELSDKSSIVSDGEDQPLLIPKEKVINELSQNKQWTLTPDLQYESYDDFLLAIKNYISKIDNDGKVSQKRKEFDDAIFWNTFCCILNQLQLGKCFVPNKNNKEEQKEKTETENDL